MAFKALVILGAYCLCSMRRCVLSVIMASWQIVYIFIEFLMSFPNLQIVLIVRSFIAQKPVSSAALCK
ncbi:hypothetical protein T03_10786 [Trichinella britovi]|uniref:Uncharacterized protein n=1 Tax=Trichinella britovi TaxID=45882 RepID=A0A0V0ZQY5_TRIBR|nr:hypothetical protein T03_10786 [Trichinella britovi]